ncbi:hypothetical protein C8R45DRAFT_931929 [Mycena sanguinolenta]|nr:hypothetical protein C8R45DRAFT_931929 [Mycena sanguinolenta]
MARVLYLGAGVPDGFGATWNLILEILRNILREKGTRFQGLRKEFEDLGKGLAKSRRCGGEGDEGKSKESDQLVDASHVQMAPSVAICQQNDLRAEFERLREALCQTPSRQKINKLYPGYTSIKTAPHLERNPTPSWLFIPSPAGKFSWIDQLNSSPIPAGDSWGVFWHPEPWKSSIAVIFDRLSAGSTATKLATQWMDGKCSSTLAQTFPDEDLGPRVEERIFVHLMSGPGSLFGQAAPTMVDNGNVER